MFENGYEFMRDFTPLLNYLAIKPVCVTVNNTQDNAIVEQVHQVIYNITVTKDNDKIFVLYRSMGLNPRLYSMGDIGLFYHCTIGSIPGQYFFCRDMIFNL